MSISEASASTADGLDAGDDDPVDHSRPVDHSALSRTTTLGRQLLVGFALVALIYAVSPNSDGSDGYLAIPAAHSLYHDADLDLSEFRDADWFSTHYALIDVEGRSVDYFPWLTAVAAVPVVAAWEALSWTGITRDPGDMVAEASFTRLRILSASLISALAATLLGLLAFRLVQLAGNGRRTAVSWLAIDGRWTVTTWIVVIGLGTSLWSIASRSTWQHGPSVALGAAAMLMLVAALREQRNGPWFAACAGALVSLAYWARPTNVVLTLVLCGVLAARRPRLLVAAGAAVVGAHALVVATNLALLGTALPPYFTASRVGWHGDLPEALAANMISPARGLLVFSPFLLGAAALLLPSRRAILGRDLGTYALVAGLGAAGYLVVVSAFGEKWWAGHSFGPRFMTETLVLLAPLALIGIFGPRAASPPPRRAGRTLAVLAIGWSVLVHMTGAHVPSTSCWNGIPEDIDTAPQ
ncbi:MAG: hypothetical protein ACK4V6_13580, partial [Microthrixaceae bacterium]